MDLEVNSWRSPVEHTASSQCKPSDLHSTQHWQPCPAHGMTPACTSGPPCVQRPHAARCIVDLATPYKDPCSCLQHMSGMGWQPKPYPIAPFSLLGRSTTSAARPSCSSRTKGPASPCRGLDPCLATQKGRAKGGPQGLPSCTKGHALALCERRPNSPQGLPARLDRPQDMVSSLPARAHSLTDCLAAGSACAQPSSRVQQQGGLRGEPLAHPLCAA